MDTVCSSAQSGPASPGQAKQQPLHLLRALPFCCVVPGSSSDLSELPSVPLPSPILPASARASFCLACLLALRLVGAPAVCWEVHAPQPHQHPQHMILDDFAHVAAFVAANLIHHPSSTLNTLAVCLPLDTSTLPAGWQPTLEVDSTCRIALMIACMARPGQASTMSSQPSSNFDHPDPRS